MLFLQVLFYLGSDPRFGVWIFLYQLNWNGAVNAELHTQALILFVLSLRVTKNIHHSKHVAGLKLFNTLNMVPRPTAAPLCIG